MKVRPMLIVLALWTAALAAAPPQPAAAQEFVVKSIAEKKVKELPTGPLYWRIETFPALPLAQAAETPTSLSAEVDSKAWLFTIGPKGGSTSGGTTVAEIGPVPPVDAPEYLLRINRAGGPPGAKTAVHMHPGSESFYVLNGELTQKTPQGARHIDAGEVMPGHGPGMPMEVSSTGNNDLTVLVMFLLDASKPFSSPAKFE
jgi:quercetin dioxygenase-like cupin family protein